MKRYRDENGQLTMTLAHFQSFDGKNLFIPSDSLGTFLPDVASDGMELVAVE